MDSARLDATFAAQRRPRRLEPKPLAQATEYLESYRQFWEASFTNLDALLTELKADLKMTALTLTPHGDSAILISRTFNAPRSLVWRAYTEPELVKRWLGVRAGWTLPICESRDGALNSGMARGVGESYDMLAELLLTLE